MITPRFLAVTVGLSLAFLSSLALVQPTPSVAGELSEDLIDTFRIHKKKGIQGPIAVAYNSLHEEYLAVWSDEKDFRVYGRRIRLHPHRGKVVRPKQVISSVTGMPSYIALAYNSNQDTYLVVWSAFNARYRNAKLWGTVVDAHGRPRSVGWELSEDPDEGWLTPLSLSVTYNDVEDSWLVVWQDELFDGAVSRVIAGDGSSVGPIVRLHVRGLWPAVARNPVRNEYLVVRQRVGNVAGQFRGPAGEALGPQFVIARKRMFYHQEYPSVAWIPDTDRWVVVWRSGADILGAIVDHLGVLPSFVIAKDSGSCIWDCGPSLSYSPANKQILVVWDNNNDIEGRWIDRIGVPRGGVKRLQSGPAVHSTSSQGVACSQEKPHCLLTWTFSGRKNTNDYNVLGGLVGVPSSGGR